MKNNNKHHLLIEIDPKIRARFKAYCFKQRVSMRLALVTLMESAVKKNVIIEHQAEV